MASRVFHAGAFPTGTHHPLMGPENHGAHSGGATVAGSHVIDPAFSPLVFQTEELNGQVVSSLEQLQSYQAEIDHLL